MPQDPTPSRLADSPEWRALFQQHEHIERSALQVKLIATALYALGVAAGQDAILLGLIVLVLWLQEVILRTMQARVNSRILWVEAQWRGEALTPGSAPFQLHSQWKDVRPNWPGLFREYASHAKRPTVAFPYAVLLVHLLWLLI